MNFFPRDGERRLKPGRDVPLSAPGRYEVSRALADVVDVAFVVSEVDQKRPIFVVCGSLHQDVSGHGIVEDLSLRELREDPLEAIDEGL